MRAISRLHIVARGGVMETKAITLSESLAVETEDTCSLSTQTRNKSNIGHDARDHLASGCAKLHSNLTMSENPLVQPLEKIRIRLWNVVIKITLDRSDVLRCSTIHHKRMGKIRRRSGMITHCHEDP
jgi:hypothetical protein